MVVERRTKEESRAPRPTGRDHFGTRQPQPSRLRRRPLPQPSRHDCFGRYEQHRLSPQSRRPLRPPPIARPLRRHDHDKHHHKHITITNPNTKHHDDNNLDRRCHRCPHHAGDAGQWAAVSPRPHRARCPAGPSARRDSNSGNAFTPALDQA